MKIKTILLIIFIIIAQNLYANTEKYLSSMSVAGISAVSSALSKADVALSKSIINPTILKGNYGESFIGKFYLNEFLKKTGAWESLFTGFKPQGIDQLFIKYDRYGNMKQILIAEVKYGEYAKLGNTVSGIQMGKKWIQKNLLELGENYRRLACSNFEIKRIPSNINVEKIKLKIGNAKKVTLWRADKYDSWKLDGSANDIVKVKNKLFKIGNFLEKSSSALSNVRGRVYEIKPMNNKMWILVKNTDNIDTLFAKYRDINIVQSKLKATEIFEIKVAPNKANLIISKKDINSYNKIILKKNKISIGDLNSLKNSQKEPIKISLKKFKNLNSQVIEREMIKELKRSFPHLPENEIQLYAKSIISNNTFLENIGLKNYSFARYALRNSLKSGAIGGGAVVLIEGTYQFLTTGELDYKRLGSLGALGFVSTNVGTLAGEYATAFLLKNRTFYNMMLQSAKRLNLPVSRLIHFGGGFAGGMLGGSLFALGEYFMGYCTQEEAKNMMVSETAALLGSGAYIGVLSSVAGVSLGEIASFSTLWTILSTQTGFGLITTLGLWSLPVVAAVGSYVAIKCFMLRSYEIKKEKEYNKMIINLLTDFSSYGSYKTLFKPEADSIFKYSKNIYGY